MFKTVILLLVSVLSCATGATIPDGRIVGGAATTIEQHSYQVSLQYYGSHICGGSILSVTIILTAAHCVIGRDVTSLSIRAGSTYHNSGGQVIAVNGVSQHPFYHSSTNDYDAALLQLSVPILFSSSASRVYLTASTCQNDQTANVTGWGTLSSGGASPTKLYKVELKTITSESCRAYYPYGKITSRMICASAPGKDSCQGDSGGPLVSNGILFGVVSWGYGCADPDYPGVYTDVSTLRAWIRQITGF